MASWPFGAEYVLPVTIRDERTRILTTTRSLRRIAFESPGQRWHFEITLALASDAYSVETLLGKLQAHQAEMGVSGTFPVVVPQHRGTRFELPTGAVAPVPTAAAAAGADEVMVQWPSVTGQVTIPAGRMFRFGTSPKAHMMTRNLVMPDAQTPVAAHFRPGLRQNISAGMPGRMRLGAAGLAVQCRYSDANEFAVTYERRGQESSYIPMVTAYLIEAV